MREFGLMIIISDLFSLRMLGLVSKILFQLPSWSKLHVLWGVRFREDVKLDMLVNDITKQGRR